LVFSPATFSAEFHKTTTFKTTMEGPKLTLTTDAPKAIVFQEPFLIPMTLKNTTAEEFSNVVVSIALPDGFTVDSAEPSFEKTLFSEVNWTIDKLPAGAEWEGKLTGHVTIIPSSPSLVFTIKTGVLVGGDLYTTQEEQVTLPLQKQDIAVKLSVNGSETGAPLNFGDKLSGTVLVKNLGDADMNDAELDIAISETGGTLLRWDALDGTPKAKVSSEAGDITLTHLHFTKKELKSLGKLPPAGEISFDFRVPIIGPAEAAGLTGDPMLTTSATLSVPKDGGEPRTVPTAPIVTFLNSDLRFRALGRYYGDDTVALGSGLLPPEAGSETSIRVILDLKNTLHELKDVHVVVSLGDGAHEIKNLQADAGEIKWNQTAGEVQWTLNRFPKSVTQIGATFDLIMLPGAKDVGKLLTLVSSAVATATDTKTGGEIKILQAAITSNLDDDPQAKGKGVVVQK
jgi:hypothetical protein